MCVFLLEVGQYLAHFLRDSSSLGFSLSGKTLLAKSAARDSKAHVLLVNGPSIVVSGYGETEKALKSLFDAAIEIGNSGSARSSNFSKANRYSPFYSVCLRVQGGLQRPWSG